MAQPSRWGRWHSAEIMLQNPGARSVQLLVELEESNANLREHIVAQNQQIQSLIQMPPWEGVHHHQQESPTQQYQHPQADRYHQHHYPALNFERLDRGNIEQLRVLGVQSGQLQHLEARGDAFAPEACRTNSPVPPGFSGSSSPRHQTPSVFHKPAPMPLYVNQPHPDANEYGIFAPVSEQLSNELASTRRMLDELRYMNKPRRHPSPEAERALVEMLQEPLPAQHLSQEFPTLQNTVPEPPLHSDCRSTHCSGKLWRMRRRCSVQNECIWSSSSWS